MSNDANAVAAEVERVATLDLAGLRELWATRYGQPPMLRSVAMLRHLLAWRIQADAFGGLDRANRRELQRKGNGEAEGLHLGIGARLTREWQGRQIEIFVEADGFRWEERTFRSLSATATAITGSRWNGPRFFGLRTGLRTPGT